MLIADNLWLWAQIGALAFFGSLAVSGFMSIAGLGDASDGRSAHKGIIPTAGGLGVLAGLGLALCAVGLIFPDLNLPLSFASLMALVFAIGMLGLIDDVLTLGAKMKFGIMLMICGAAVWLIGPPKLLPFFGYPIKLPVFVGFMGAMLWIFVVMNAVNFMDGANGMMGLLLMTANAGLFALGIIGGSAITLLLSGLSLMVILGFMPYNLRKKARVFAGDVGALSLSFLFAVTVLCLILETPDAIYHLVGPALILPILADVLLTMARRLWAGDRLLQAHNKHLYQRLIRVGFGHLTVSWLYALAAMLCALIAVFGAPRGWFNTLDIPLMMVGAITAAYIIISRALTERERRLANAGDDKSS